MGDGVWSSGWATPIARCLARGCDVIASAAGCPEVAPDGTALVFLDASEMPDYTYLTVWREHPHTSRVRARPAGRDGNIFHMRAQVAIVVLCPSAFALELATQNFTESYKAARLDGERFALAYANALPEELLEGVQAVSFRCPPELTLICISHLLTTSAFLLHSVQSFRSVLISLTAFLRAYHDWHVRAQLVDAALRGRWSLPE